MAKYKLVVLEPAISELENACVYYNDQLVGLGYEFEEEIFMLLELINYKPLLFPIKFATIREAVVRRFPYVINYEIAEKIIIVSAIFHTKQNPSKKTKQSTPKPR
jgi:hypothetical protein